MAGPEEKIFNFIGGEMVPPVSGDYIEDADPATGVLYALVPDSDEKDLQFAVDAAKKVFPLWRDTPPEKRAAMMNRLADLIEARFEDFARAESIDTGKPVSLCRAVDIPRGIANLRAFAAAAARDFTQNFETENSRSYTLRRPYGVVATISPWNLPLLLFTWKIGPALASGNCVIAKPSEVTPMSASMLAQLVNEAGFPPGVLNIVHGRGPKIGTAITNHPDIPAISFTGGTSTGIEIYKGAAAQLKKVSLELGGKNPTIVFADADWDAMMDGATRSAFANQGQVCLCGSRILVQNTIYDKFKAELVVRAEALKIGDPLEDSTQHGAMSSKMHMEKVLGYIDLARQEGGSILTGGKRRIMEGRCRDGYFIEPTVIEGLSYTCRTNQEEIFGPVVTLIPFKTEEEALMMANSTQYGLAASLWTTDKEQARRMAEKLESGIIWLNCWNLRDLETPFGGVKKSGVGREGVTRAMEFFTQEISVTMPR